MDKMIYICVLALMHFTLGDESHNIITVNKIEHSLHNGTDLIYFSNETMLDLNYTSDAFKIDEDNHSFKNDAVETNESISVTTENDVQHSSASLYGILTTHSIIVENNVQHSSAAALDGMYTTDSINVEISTNENEYQNDTDSFDPIGSTTMHAFISITEDASSDENLDNFADMYELESSTGELLHLSNENLTEVFSGNTSETAYYIDAVLNDTFEVRNQTFYTTYRPIESYTTPLEEKVNETVYKVHEYQESSVPKPTSIIKETLIPIDFATSQTVTKPEMTSLNVTSLPTPTVTSLPTSTVTSLPTPTVTSQKDICPIGCRCSAPVHVTRRHYWHRLLTQYRMRKLIYGNRPDGYGFKSNQIHAKPKAGEGREMSCVGLDDIPDYVPEDISKVAIYGNMRDEWRPPADQPYFSDVTYVNDPPYDVTTSHRKLKQISSVSKLSVIPSSGVKKLWIEGNRIKVLHSNDLLALPRLRSMHMRSNRLKLLAQGVFTNLQNIQEIDLAHNHLKHLLKDTFTGLHKLKRISVAHNRLVMLHGDIFLDLDALENMDMSYNFLIELPDDVFRRNMNLKQLDLSFNRLSMLRTGWFQHLASLEKLYLRGNRLAEIPDLVFSPLGNLTLLNLDKNNIEEVKETSFYGLANLKQLRIQHNNLSVIEEQSFENCTKLESLNLDNNRLSSLSVALFGNLSLLKTLILSRNIIDDLHAEMFVNLSSLEKLDVSHNHIEVIKSRNFDGLTNLKILYLHHNKISKIEDDGFAIGIIPKLTWLFLNFNRITTLTRPKFNGLFYLKMLNIAHNEIELVAEDTFTQMAKLNTLLMNSNSISYLPPGLFRSMQSLRHMNLASNRIEVLEDSIFSGLNWLEDLSLQNNELSQCNIEVFRDTPKLSSLNLRKNKLPSLDLNIVDVAYKLRYLDASFNHIRLVHLPPNVQEVLAFLSLADNSLQTISPNLTKLISHGGKMHLYGNPWRCDCDLDWLPSALENINIAEGKAKLQAEVIFEGKEELQCKTPSRLTGERLLGLDPQLMTCSTDDFYYQSDEGLYSDIMTDEARLESSTGCDFSPFLTESHRAPNSSFAFSEPIAWLVVFYDMEGIEFCRGVRLGIKHILTPKHCWKSHTMQVKQVYVKYDTSSTGPKTFKAEIGSVEHFKGNLEFSLIKLQRPEFQSGKRIFPCLLSENGIFHSQNVSKEMVLVLRQETERFGSAIPVEYESMSGNVITQPCIEGFLCLKSEHLLNRTDFSNSQDNQYTDKSPYDKDQSVTQTVHENEDLMTTKQLHDSNKKDVPVFIKVSPSKWALAGFGDVKKYGNVLTEPVYELAEWVHNRVK